MSETKQYHYMRIYTDTHRLMQNIIKLQPVGEEESQVELLHRLVKQEYEKRPERGVSDRGHTK